MADEALTAGAVARRLGIAVTTLRTWHQRYGLGPSQHVPGHHRRYTSQDLERLEVMRRLTGQGVPAAEAASWARRVPLHNGSPPAGSAAGLFDPPAAPAIGPVDSPTASAADLFDSTATTARAGGGHTISLGPATPAARGLARAAMRLDGPAMRDILEMVIAERGVIDTWNEVVAPVLIGVGERYEATRRFIEVEHLVSRCVTEVLGAVPRPAGAVPQVLLASADEELHTLPLEALAAALAEAGVASRLFGARVPPTALAEAIARTGPTVVVLWSQLPSTGDPDQLKRVLTGPHPPLVTAAAGPGWHPPLPHGVVQLTSLPHAVETIRAAAPPS